MFDIVITYDKGKGQEKINCPGKTATIGKSRDNLVQIRGWRIAHSHAVLEQTEKGIYIEDRSDGSGVLVNGNKVTRYGPLRSADVINIAAYELQVGISNQDQPKKTPPSVTKPIPSAPGSAPSVEPAVSAPGVEAKVTPVKLEAESFEDMSMQTMIGNVHTFTVAQGEGIEQAQQAQKYMWRNRLHQEVLRMMDLRRTDIGSMDEAQLRSNIEGLIEEALKALDSQIPDDIDRDRLKSDVLNEAVGLGPLEELLADEAVTEIMVNGFDDIYVERSGNLTKSHVSFSSDEAVMSAIERIVTPLGRRIDESSPLVDARLKDGSRVNAIIPPLALKGPCLTIRKFSKEKLTYKDVLRFKSANEAMVSFMETAVVQRCNVVISGGTGSGKTTLLNILSNFIPHEERVVTVEDAAELQLNQPNLVSLESRPPNVEGKGAVPIRELVKNCLRMRPDRIVVGECRGGEALDMLQAMNTGHDGSLTTAHANTPRDLIARLEVMVMMSGMDLPVKAIREQVASAVDIVVQQTRFSDGSRRITHISEVTGVEGDIVQLNDIFLYKQKGFDENGKVTGAFFATGQVPQLYQDLRERGIDVDMSIFGD
jgi:pilus assembly protein CpaF